MQGSIYQFKDLILIPTLAETDDGFFLETEPVEVLSKPTHDDLLSALQRVVERANPSIRTPPRDGFPPSVVHARAGVRSQREFDRVARLWVFESSAAGILLIPTVRGATGGFLHKRDEAEQFTGTSALSLIAERVLQSIH